MNVRQLLRLRKLYPRKNYLADYSRCYSGKTDPKIGLIFGEKYKIFQDQDADVILDSNEEQLNYPLAQKAIEDDADKYAGINLTRKYRSSTTRTNRSTSFDEYLL